MHLSIHPSNFSFQKANVSGLQNSLDRSKVRHISYVRREKRQDDLCHISVTLCRCPRELHLNLSQDQEERLEKELAEEKRKKMTAVAATEKESSEEEERLRELLAEAEVRERER